jgi:hypothetical protein
MPLARPLARAAALLAALAPTGCRGPSGPKVTLRYQPPAGAAYRYALEQAMALRLEGTRSGAARTAELTMHVYYTQAVTGPTAGGIAATVTYDSLRFVPAGYAPALDRMRGLTSSVVYDDRGQVVSARFTTLGDAASPLLERIGTSVLATAFPLPDQPVGVGDSWRSDDARPGDALGVPIKARMRFTVKEIRAAAADTVVLVAVEGSFPRDPVTVTQPSPQGVPVERVVRVTGRLTGERLLSVAKGVPLRASIAGVLTVLVSGGLGGAEETTLSQQSTLTLLGATGRR